MIDSFNKAGRTRSTSFETKNPIRLRKCQSNDINQVTKRSSFSQHSNTRSLESILFAFLFAPLALLAETRIQVDSAAKLITLEISDRLEPNETWIVEFTSSLSRTGNWETIEPTRDVALPTGERQLTVSYPNSDVGYFRLRRRAIISETYPLLLNEIMSNNRSSHPDDDGEFSDWIELYNPNPDSVSLEDWYLTDNLNSLTKWAFPKTEIPGETYLLVYASGKNKREEEAPLHTNFRISANGESIALTRGADQLVDQITLGRLANDESIGRNSSSNREWFLFEAGTATPALENNLESATAYVLQPEFESTPGLYEDGLLFQLSHPDPEATLLYTTDGSLPDADSSVYEAAFPIQTHTVIRAVAQDAAGNISKVATGSFLVGTEHTLPIVSLVASPENFEIRDGFLYGFGEHMYPNSGFSANFPYSASNAWKDREIAASLEFFEADSDQSLRQDIGLKIFGGWGSRGYPQKSLALFARAKYGKGKIEYPLFPDLEIDEFESVILRNSGNDNQSTHQIPPRPPIRAFGPTQGNGSYFVNGTFTLFRDAMMQTVAENLDVDRQAYRPTVLYLNGNYWGIYNLREKLNEHYVASHHNVPSDEIDLIEGYSNANAGSNRIYRQARSYVRRFDLSLDERFEAVATQYVNISSFIDYHLAVIYFQNFDIGNIKQWRAQDGGTFRWMLYDQDYGFHLWPEEVYLPAMARDYSDYDNMFAFYTNPEGTSNGWPNAGGRTLFLRRLLLNKDFESQFITRCLDLLNTDFRSQRVRAIIERLAAQIRPEIPAHLARWSWENLQEQNHGIPFKGEDAPLDISHWEDNVQILLKFADERPAKLRNDLTRHFRLHPSQTAVTLRGEPADGGTVQINSIDVATFPWAGTYLQQVPSQLMAKPREGFTFVGWEGSVESPETAATILNTAGETRTTITARFEPIGQGNQE